MAWIQMKSAGYLAEGGSCVELFFEQGFVAGVGLESLWGSLFVSDLKNKSLITSNIFFVKFTF